MKYYRSYEINGKEREACVDADNEIDAETEFDYLEQDITRGDSMVEFEWTSSIYDLKTKIQTEQSETKR